MAGAGPKPDLIIPVKMDLDAVLAALKKLGAAGQKAGQDGKEGMEGAARGAKNFGSELATILKVQIGLSAVKQVATAMGSEYARAADHVRQVAAEFIKLRQTMQEVATLQGKPVTTEYTLEQARAARAAHLAPEEYRDFQAEFLNYAGSQVGEGGKLSNEEGEKYGARVAEMMKAAGIQPKIGAELAGSILEQSNGKQNVDELMTRFGKTFQVLQKGRVPLSRALPEISQILAMGVSPEDAAKMYSIVSPAAAGQEGTSVQAALRAVQEMKNKGTGEEFGVKRGMSQYESVKSFAQNITERKRKLMAQGKTEQQAEDEVMAQLQQKNVASDIRESRGLVRGFGRMGVQLGGFETYERIERETPRDYEQNLRKQYEGTETGQQALRDADEAVARAEAGARNARAQEMMQEARARVIRRGDLESARAGNLWRKTLGGISGVSTEQQLINEEALRASREAGVRAGVVRPESAGAGRLAVDSQLMTQLDVNREIVATLRMIERNTGRGPLSAPPPRPGSRQGG